LGGGVCCFWKDNGKVDVWPSTKTVNGCRKNVDGGDQLWLSRDVSVIERKRERGGSRATKRVPTIEESREQRRKRRRTRNLMYLGDVHLAPKSTCKTLRGLDWGFKE